MLVCSLRNWITSVSILILFGTFVTYDPLHRKVDDRSYSLLVVVRQSDERFLAQTYLRV